jgi:lysophospholipase L1-like esterase
MIKGKYHHVFLAAVFLTLCKAPEAAAGDNSYIFPGDKRIYISGAHYLKIAGKTAVLQRHSDSVLALPQRQSRFNSGKARTTTGITISFISRSRIIRAFFRKMPGIQRFGKFSVRQNGEITGVQPLFADGDSLFSLNIASVNPGLAVDYEITLPVMNNLVFTELETDTAELEIFPFRDKEIYVAYGNSITHGTGQAGTFETYPYQLARKFGWELYNVAVGGAQTSIAIAEMLRDDFEVIDYMTVLVGYNDWNAGGIDTVEYQNRVDNLLSTVRQKHPETKIFCITQTYTRRDTSKNSDVPVEDIRKALANLVKSRIRSGDMNLFLINGDKITSEANLKDPSVSSDPVHFSIQGAALFADSLERKIRGLVDNPVKIDGGKETGTGTEDEGMYIYPNPSRGQFHIKFDKAVNRMEIYNIQGRRVRGFKTLNSSVSISGLASGIYFIRYTDPAGNRHTEKFILK